MEKKHEITAKQLAFLDRFLNKYDFGSEDDKIELKDHIISDFEMNGNGNLSQYLSEELDFIKKFIGSKTNSIVTNYREQTRKEFKLFLTSLNKLPITIFIAIAIFFLTNYLNETYLFVTFFISVMSFIIYNFFFLQAKRKGRQKFDKLRFLGQEMWLPYLMICFPLFFFKDFANSNKIFFGLYWFVALIYAIAAIVVVKRERKIIYEKYKHLLN